MHYSTRERSVPVVVGAFSPAYLITMTANPTYRENDKPFLGRIEIKGGDAVAAELNAGKPLGIGRPHVKEVRDSNASTTLWSHDGDGGDPCDPGQGEQGRHTFGVGIAAGREPLTDLDQLVKDWRSQGGDQIQTGRRRAAPTCASASPPPKPSARHSDVVVVVVLHAVARPANLCAPGDRDWRWFRCCGLAAPSWATTVIVGA